MAQKPSWLPIFFSVFSAALLVFQAPTSSLSHLYRPLIPNHALLYSFFNSLVNLLWQVLHSSKKPESGPLCVHRVGERR